MFSCKLLTPCILSVKVMHNQFVSRGFVRIEVGVPYSISGYQ